MSAVRGPAGAVPPWTLAVGAMLCVRLGSALSVPLIEEVGAAGTAGLRLSIGALVLLALARPPLRSVRRTDVLPLLGLGVASGLLTVCFLAAIERIPLGTAVAVEFLGPLTVAAVRSSSVRALRWPALALVGVIGLTEPWRGEIDVAGVGFAAGGAVGWGACIVLTQRVGDRFTGLSALSMTVPVAAATAAVVGVPQAAGALTVGVLAAAAGLALLFPVLQYALVMLALRRTTQTALGTLTALEPTIGLLLGLVVLSQQPSPVQRGGQRPVPTGTTPEPALAPVTTHTSHQEPRCSRSTCRTVRAARWSAASLRACPPSPRFR